MTTNNEKPIGTDAGILTRPGTAVTNFAADTIEYAMFGLDQIFSRLPLINQSAISVAKRIPEITSLIMSGSLSRISVEKDIKEYEVTTAGIREKKVDIGAYSEYQHKLSNIYHDVDYALLLSDRDLTQEEETKYLHERRMEFLDQLPKEPFQALNVKSFSPDVHGESVILKRRFEAMQREAEEKRRISEEEYAKYIKTRDKIINSILDDRPPETRPPTSDIPIPEIPVVLYMPKPIETIEDKMRRGTLRTRKEWDNTTWTEAMSSFEKLFPEQHKEEKIRIQEETKKGFYGTISPSEVSTIVLQKLGLV